MISNQNFCRTLSDASDSLSHYPQMFRHLSQINHFLLLSETNSITTRLQKHQNSLSAVGHRVRHVRHTNTNTEQQ
jgi:hypothetical protein